MSEIQRLAKELNKIPTEEAKILADLSKSKLSYDVRGSNSINQNSIIGDHGGRGFTLGMIGNNESSVLMDLNRASIIKAQEDYKAREEAAIRQQVKRIVEGSATRMEPLMAEFADAPLHESFSKGIARDTSGHSRQLSNYSLGPRSRDSLQQPIKVPQGQQNLTKNNIRISRRSNSQMSNNMQRNRNYDSSVMEAAGEHTIQPEQADDDEKLDQIEVLATSKDPHKRALRNHYAGDMLLQDDLSPKNKSRGSR